jgi:CheY-like chemotaxis protein
VNRPGPRVLVADDDEDLRRLLARRLGRRGWDVVEAADGAEAVRLAQTHAPAVVVLDRSMPVMGGLDALAALRADPRTAHVPVVLLSAEEPVAAEAAGADAQLSKPFEFAALDALLRRLAGA